MFKNPAKIVSFIIFMAIFLLAAYFRLHGTNWDQNQHLHPDERFLTMVTGAIAWPKDIKEFLNTGASPLNPHNKGFNFFVYGTFPLFFTKYIAETFKLADYNGITIIGRRLSAIFDLLTVVFVFLTVKEVFSEITKNPKIKSGISFLPHLAMFFYAALVLPIQLSHFYAVDTYLTFFTLFSFYLLIKINKSKNQIFQSVLLGIALGLAVASKISAVYFFPVIGIGLITSLIRNKNFLVFIRTTLIIAIFGFITVRLAQPYMFKDQTFLSYHLNPKILDNWKELKSFDNPNSYFPPGVQWIKTKPYFFPLKNLLFWGMGLPLGLISTFALVILIWKFFRDLLQRKFISFLEIKSLILNLSIIWIIALFAYQGNQFVKALRYFVVLYPFLAIIAAWLTYNLIFKILRNFRFGSHFISLFIIMVLVYPVSFSSIYSRENSRIAASRWIYGNIPQGARLSGELWDDFIPMSLPDPGMIHEKYQSVEFPLYNEDNREKWEAMNQKLHNTDYIIMSSNRLYGSIMTVSEKYPVTYKFYNSLFDGSLGFEKIAEFTSRPSLDFPYINICLTPPFVRYGIVALKTQDCPLPGISFVDDYADETFTVYDHPKVVIFKKVRPQPDPASGGIPNDYINFLYKE